MPTLFYRDSGVTAQVISENQPTTVFSNSTSSTQFEATSAVIVSRGIYKFTMVPPGGAVTVTSATLDLFNDNFTARATSRVVEARRILSTWNTLEASWNNKATATPWAVAGAIGGAEVSGTVMATGTCPTAAQTPFAMTGAGLIAYCQDILNGATDYGFILNLIDDQTVTEVNTRAIGGTANSTATKRPTLTIEYTTGTPVNWTINSPTVDSDAGTVTLTVTLDAPAPGGGFSGLVNTYDITAVAGVDYTAQVNVPFSISAGNTTGNIVIPILP